MNKLIILQPHGAIITNLGLSEDLLLSRYRIVRQIAQLLVETVNGDLFLGDLLL